MLDFRNLNIKNKLRILSAVSVFSIVVLGFISNYFFKTSKMLGIIINAERIHNNTFQEGVEDYYKFQSTGNRQLLDTAIVKIETANQMAYQFAIIDQSLQLPKNEYINIFYHYYKEAYNYDRSNAYLMANRIKLFLMLKNDKLAKAQEITRIGYLLGEKIKKEIHIYQTDTILTKSNSIEEDLTKIRAFYRDFAVTITSLDDFANSLFLAGIILIVILLVITVSLISTLISKSIVDPVQEMVLKFGVIARGNLNTEISIDTDNEIGKLANSFREIQNGLRKVIEHTKKVAAGDYNTQISPRSDEDELSIALNKMVIQLKESYEKAELDSWYKSGINLLNEKLSGDQNTSAISGHSLSFMMDFLHSQLGSIYLYNSEYQSLKLNNSAGFDPKKLKDRIKLNEGLSGRAGAEKRIISLSDISDDAYITYSASGEFNPKQVVAVPLLFNEILVGVLELSSNHSYSEIEIQFLEDASEIIAINLSSAISILKTSELLQKTQDQASELQVQQEELRVANEELTEHTKVLTESEKRLQVQQEELRVANEELEERTRQLEIQKDDISLKNKELTDTRDKLEIKAKELQLASQYKSEFLANMSHELRTPLNSLLILSNLLGNNKKGNLTDDQVRSAKIIHKSGTDLLYLINEVLDLSKIEAGKMSVEIGSVKTIDIKEEILMNFNATAEDKKLAFEVHIDQNFPSQFDTDRYRLMQILRNLLSNAFKFTVSGGVTVDFMPVFNQYVFRNPDLNSSNSCCIRVTDTGVGIPAEKMEAIFEAFQQADGSISRKFGGTGLGLSISKELVRMLGGEIQLESKINKGSSFYIYLPVKQLSEQEITESRQIQTDSMSENVNIQSDTNEKKQQAILPIFISDDRDQAMNEPTVLIIHPLQQQAEKFLQQARAKNYKAIAAATINDGILLAEKFYPKAIMLAVELARNKGKQNYHKLKSHPLISKLPVHLISPIDYGEPAEETELKTLETVEFADALKQLDTQMISHSKRILIVEDDMVTRQLVKDLLSELDIEIKEANYAEAAFEIMTKENFDCIILDLGLPDYSGKELLEKLKLNGISIPKVIVYTGKELMKEDIKNLNSFTNTIILKGLKSDERLMDEITLFLHQVSKTISGAKAKAHSSENDTLFKGKKILVVDDEIRNVFALGKVLEENEIEVFEAENGQIAIDILKENKSIDLVLMDVMMPVMNGYEAMRIIRSTPEIMNIPIICLTAKAMKEDQENALKNGANDYLSKPLNEEKLFAMLKIWLYKK